MLQSSWDWRWILDRYEINGLCFDLFDVESVYRTLLHCLNVSLYQVTKSQTSISYCQCKYTSSIFSRTVVQLMKGEAFSMPVVLQYYKSLWAWFLHSLSHTLHTVARVSWIIISCRVVWFCVLCLQKVVAWKCIDWKTISFCIE